ncbi:MAG: hypothetical protein K0M45_03295 [Candidatus Paracaedibacteraceae bacterium]|nr:hypothetical protein [Candidatus Paracaedibacteraceae bacterium]
MPLIDDFTNKKTKKFTKKEYRPWDFEEPSQENNESILIASIPPERSVDHNVKESPQVLNVEKIETSFTSQSTTEHDYSKLSKREESYSLDLEKYARGIYGLQRIILQNLLQRIEKKDELFFYTHPILFKELASLLKAPITSLKGTIYRLRELKVLEVYEYKPGRGGYTSYKIPIPVGSFFIKYFEEKTLSSFNVVE